MNKCTSSVAGHFNYHPGGRQGDSKQNKDAKCVHFADHFDGHCGAPVPFRTHCPMEEVRGFHESH